MFRAIVSVALLVAGLALAAPPEVPECKVVKVKGGSEFECGSVEGSLLELTHPGPLKDELAGWLGALNAGLKGKAKARGEPAELKDLGVPGLRLIVDWPDGVRGEGYVFAVQGPGTAILLICQPNKGRLTLEACRTALNAVFFGAPASDVTLMGRTFKLSGCSTKSNGANGSTCEGNGVTLTWTQFDVPLNRKKLDDAENNATAGLKVTRLETPPCSILGEPAFCRSLLADTGKGSFRLHTGITAYGGWTVLVQCMSHPDLGALPAPCNQLFGGKSD